MLFACWKGFGRVLLSEAAAEGEGDESPSNPEEQEHFDEEGVEDVVECAGEVE